MKDFIQLNRHKIVFGLKWTSIVFTSIVSGIFVWAFSIGQRPEWALMLTVFLGAGIFLPMFIMAIGTYQEFDKYGRMKQIIESYPFNELLKRGFSMMLKHESNRWTMTQQRIEGQFNGYPIEGELEESNFKLIALVNLERVSKYHVNHLKRSLGNERIEMDWFGISLIYNTSKERVTSFEQIAADLTGLTDYLKSENLKPEIGVA